LADRTVRVSLTAQVSGYLAGMEQAKKATRSSSDAAQEASRKYESQAQTMDKVGKGLMASGTVAVAATALAVKAAIGWESAWAGVTKTVNGTPEELQKVEDGLRSLAKTLPSSHDEIAAVAEAAGQLGIQTANVTAFTRTMIDLGETTNLSADEAATSLARFMNIMGTSQDKVANLGSTIVALGNNYATTEAEIVAMSMRLAGAGRQIGLSEGEVLGLSTALSSVGIEAEAGGSAFSTLMVNIASEVETGGAKLDLFAKTSGKSAADFKAQWEKDPAAALTGFISGLGSVEEQGGSTLQVLADLGVTEIRMRDALLRSSAASDMFAKAMGDGNKAFDENNALAKEAAQRYATVESQIEVMKNRVTDAAISFGEVFLPAVSAATGGIGDFADIIGGMDPVLQGTLAVVGLAGGAAALSGGAFLVAVPKVVAYRLAVADLGPVGQKAAGIIGKVGKAIGAVAIVGVAVGALGAFSDAMRATGKTGEELANTLITAKDGARIVSDSFADVKANWVGSGVDKIFDDFGGTIDSTFESWDTRWAGFGRDLLGARPMSDDVRDSLAKLGTEFGALASTDLPAAQKAMRQVVDQYDLSEEQLWRLIDMSPEYKAALVDQASALGITASKSNLLNIATKEAAPVATAAADAYLAAADEAAGLNDQILSLIGSMNEANGLGQDAVSSNADYRDSLEEVSEYVRQAQEGVEGFNMGLDESTVTGSANAAMLADHASTAQASAEAMLAAGGSTDDYKARLEGAHQTVYDSAIALGANAEQAQAIADKLAAIPSETAFQVIADTQSAQANLDSLAARAAVGHEHACW
jgi:TP901 family phage tail tape measure protein